MKNVAAGLMLFFVVAAPLGMALVMDSACPNQICHQNLALTFILPAVFLFCTLLLVARLTERDLYGLAWYPQKILLPPRM